MPHYHRYWLRWGKMGICIPENYNSPLTGEVLAIQTPTYPNKSPSNKTRGKWDLHDRPYVSLFFGYQCKWALFTLSYSIQDALRLARALAALAFVHIGFF